MIKYNYIGGLKLWQTEKKEVYKPKPMTEGKRNAGMPYLRTSPSSRLGMCSSVQIPYSKLPSFHNHFCIFSSDKSSMTSCLNDTTMDWKKQ